MSYDSSKKEAVNEYLNYPLYSTFQTLFVQMNKFFPIVFKKTLSIWEAKD